jgi:hypothetical protein
MRTMAWSNPEQESRSGIARVASSLPVLVLAQALPAGIAYLAGHWLGMVVGAALSTLVFVALVRTWLSKQDSMEPMAAFFIGNLTGLLAGFFLAQAGALGRGDVVRGIPVEEAPRYANAPGWIFRNGLPRTDLSAAIVRKKKGSTENRWVVAPLVSANWSPADEVPAWVGCEDGCGVEWAAPLRGGTRIVVDVGQFEEARNLAMQKHGLRSNAHAPLIEWRERPETVVPSKLHWAAMAIGLGLLLYGAACVVLAILARKEAKAEAGAAMRANEDETPDWTRELEQLEQECSTEEPGDGEGKEHDVERK